MPPKKLVGALLCLDIFQIISNKKYLCVNPSFSSAADKVLLIIYMNAVCFV